MSVQWPQWTTELTADQVTGEDQLGVESAAQGYQQFLVPGIITTTDVMEVLLQAIGIDKDSRRLTVLVRDRIGVIAEVAQLLKNHQVNIRSLVSWPERRHPGYYQLVIRVPAAAGQQAVAVLTENGFKVLTEYVADLTPYLAE